MITCTFAGHRDVYRADIDERLDAEIEKLLQMDDEFLFLTGGMGQFDGMSAGSVRSAKSRHPEKLINLALVMPYMTDRLNENKKYYESNFDQIIIPGDIENVYYKAAIGLRNRWMVDKADIVIAYIVLSFGGAVATVKYAQRKGKPVINLAE